MNGSFKCASPSIKAYEIILYLAAFLNIDAILFQYLNIIIFIYTIFTHHITNYVN